MKTKLLSKEELELAFLANGGLEFQPKNCECEPEVNQAPCRYCAIHHALTLAKRSLEAQEQEIERLRGALEGWVNYFQSDIPMTSDDQEMQGEAFTQCWFETQAALNQEAKGE